MRVAETEGDGGAGLAASCLLLSVSEPQAGCTYLGADEGRGHVLQLERRERRELLVNALEHVVVQVPRLVQLGLLPRCLVLEAPVICLVELASVGLAAGGESAGEGEGGGENAGRARKKRVAIVASVSPPSLRRSQAWRQLRRFSRQGLGTPLAPWRTWTNAISCSVVGPTLCMASCSGSRTSSIPSTLLSPKYSLRSEGGGGMDTRRWWARLRIRRAPQIHEERGPHSAAQRHRLPKRARPAERRRAPQSPAERRSALAAHLEASSSDSCHCSCHKTAMRMSSWLTSCACSTSVAECWRTLSITEAAAARRPVDWLLHATSSGYMSACGW